MIDDPVLELDNPVMKMVDYDDRYFLYVIGNHYNKQGKGKQYLVVYEYFLSPSKPIEK